MGHGFPFNKRSAAKPSPRLLLKKQLLIISDSSYAFIAESVDKGVVKYKDNKMDIYGKQGVNAGKRFTAIYKLETDQLSICYNLKGDSNLNHLIPEASRPFFFQYFKKTNIGIKYFMLALLFIV
jgi:hypothetical protein